MLRHHCAVALGRGTNRPVLLVSARDPRAPHIDIGDPIVVAGVELVRRARPSPAGGERDSVGVPAAPVPATMAKAASGEVRCVGLFTAEAYGTPAHAEKAAAGPSPRWRTSPLGRAGKGSGQHDNGKLP
ncbi:hypothetical protein ACRAWD_25820 [Caulobacter segnis]